MRHEPLHAFAAARALPEQRRPRVVIVGCGFTGAAAAVALVKAATRPLELVIIEPHEPGGGLAYGRAGETHLLNVRADELSIHADSPGDFADWAAAESAPRSGRTAGHRAAVGQSFLSRRAFGAYVRRRLDEALADAPHVAASILHDAAQEVSRGASGVAVRLVRGEPIEADVVILATGYGLGFRDRGRGDDPYAPLDAERLRRARRVVCAGTGLTMVDALTSLRAAGYRGEVVAVSRHGLLPEAHAKEAVPVYAEPIVFEPSSLSISRAVHAACRDAGRRGLPWQSVVNALRPHVARHWAALDRREQARILRHLWPYWSVRRHRLAPEAADVVARERASGKLVVRRGEVIGLDERRDSVHVLIRPRGCADVERLEADLALDCSGVRPFVPQAVDGGRALGGIGGRDPHGLGLAVAPDGALLDREGGATGDVYALGPLGQGSLLEITAAPEIVTQAAEAAGKIVARLHAKSAP